MSQRIHHHSIEIRKKTYKLGGSRFPNLGMMERGNSKLGTFRRVFRASLPRDKEVWFRELQSSLNTTSVTRRNDSNQEAADSPGGGNFWSMHNYHQRWVSNFVTTDLNGDAEVQKFQLSCHRKLKISENIFQRPTRELNGRAQRSCRHNHTDMRFPLAK